MQYISLPILYSLVRQMLEHGLKRKGTPLNVRKQSDSMMRVGDAGGYLYLPSQLLSTFVGFPNT